MIEYDGLRLFKYNYVIARLRRDIGNGRWETDGKLPSERRLCELYAVSRVTLRAALRQLREEALIEQRRGSGTYLRQSGTAASEPSPGRVWRVLLLGKTPRFPIEVDPYYSQLRLGFQHYRLPGREFQVEPLTLPGAESFAEYCRRNSPDWSGYDGILCAFPLVEQDLDWLERQGKPYVFLGHPNLARPVPLVDIDNYRGMYLAAERLLARGGHCPLLFYHGYSSPNCQARLAGYHAALAQYGIAPDSARELEVNDRTSEETEKILETILRKRLAFDCILAVGDWPALGVLNVLGRHRLKIPDQVRLAVFDAFPWLLEGVHPHPTAVVQPFVLMAEKALELLCRQAGDSNLIPQLLIRPVLVDGETT